ncbi:MAG: VCBS repeat-containing protein [Planctomycetes bacterium]|nr:VCBS repeat-containing protein [Planctomycetota bacterium]
MDNDGNLDLFVTRDGPNRLYMGDGAGGFVDDAAGRGVAAGGSCRAVAFGDVNGDGFLDLVVGIGVELHLFLNDGTGHFTDVTAAAGLSGIRATGTAMQVAQFADIDNDGDLDLYVAGWGYAWLLLNDGAGHFTDISLSSGIAPPAGTPAYTGAFGCAFGDYDNDGFVDLFIAGGEIGGGNVANLLFHNNGNLTFTELCPGLGQQPVGDRDEDLGL